MKESYVMFRFMMFKVRTLLLLIYVVWRCMFRRAKRKSQNDKSGLRIRTKRLIKLLDDEDNQPW